MRTCSVCPVPLTGNQSKFCSKKCKNKDSNVRLQNYETQKNRGRNRRLALIKLKGGKCEHCGYSKNSAALNFHHIDPSTKSFEIDMRKCSNSKLESLIAEASKCLLLCANCHAEHHNPDCVIAVEGIEPSSSPYESAILTK